MLPHRALLFGCLVLLFAGCDSDPAPTSSLDAELHDALAAAADGQGPDVFRMPSSLENIPQDPRNPLTPEKVELGRLLFHETALAVNPVKEEGRGTYACASCHHPAAGFEVAVPQGIAEGGVGFGRYGERRRLDPRYAPDEADMLPVRVPPTLNVAWQEAMLWNGQFGATGVNAGTEAHWDPETPVGTNALGYEGLETQAIAGLAVHRMADGPAAVAEAYPEYRALFDAAFPDRPDGERVSMETAGLAIAAYERTILATEAPFQRWLRGETDAMSRAQKRGAVVFFGKAECAACHAGPALSSMTFHALGMGELGGPGVFSAFNPEDPVHLGRGGFTGRDEDRYRFKTPQLYNLADHVFFGHGATFNSVREVVEYKNRAEPENEIVPADRLSPAFRPLGLSEDEIDDLVMFLSRGLYDPDLARYVPARVPSGQCFPTNDPESRRDLGCEGEQARPHRIAPRALVEGFR
jgi:cytochrome c peroxidase